MSRKGIALLAALLCLLLTACAPGESETAEWSAGQMVRALLSSQEAAEEVQTLAFGDGEFDAYAGGFYQLDPEQIADGAIVYAGGVSALELAVLRMRDGVDTEETVRTLTAYIDARAGAFAGYAPEQYAVVEHSRAVCRGQYAALLICPDADAAEEAFAACFTEVPPALEDPAPEPVPQPAPEEPAAGPPEQAEEPEDPPEPPAGPEPAPEVPVSQEEPPAEGSAPPADSPSPEEPDARPEEPEPAPEEPWSYDGQRILDAWNSGSREGLWEQDCAILDVLEGIPALRDGSLSDYERELALHDWMIAWAEYDPGALSSGPRGEPMPDNDNPYGFLTGRKGICLGYTSTFQLLMDLSGIECVTVHGMAHAGTAEHAWNLVCLDGEWYAVDTTWDDPVTSFQVSDVTAHQYFNVTDEFLRRHDHQWDESTVPAAAGTTWVWR